MAKTYEITESSMQYCDGRTDKGSAVTKIVINEDDADTKKHTCVVTDGKSTETSYILMSNKLSDELNFIWDNKGSMGNVIKSAKLSGAITTDAGVLEDKTPE